VEGELSLAEAALAAAGGEPHVLARRVCVLNSWGDLAFRRGDLEEAEALYRRALEGGAGPDAATHRRLGDVLAWRGNMD
jgi:Flp pilus assembly protein TadD